MRKILSRRKRTENHTDNAELPFLKKGNFVPEDKRNGRSWFPIPKETKFRLWQTKTLLERKMKKLVSYSSQPLGIGTFFLGNIRCLLLSGYILDDKLNDTLLENHIKPNYHEIPMQTDILPS